MRAYKFHRDFLWVVAFMAGSVIAASPAQGKTRQEPTASSPAAPGASAKQKATEVKSVGSPSVSVGEEQVYRIGVEDELQISIWHEPELSTTAVVRPDGKITMPLLNDFVVIGLRPDELQTLIGQKLKPFINEAQVTVIPKTIRSRKVYLMGNVGKQGSYPLNGTKTVLELIADAGGLTQFAKSGSIYVLRTENGKKTRIAFNYKKAVSGKADSLTLFPGDVVVVP